MALNKSVIFGIMFGLIIATTTIYGSETYEHVFEEFNILEGPFFLIFTLLYIPIGFIAIKYNSKWAFYTILIGTIVLFVLYGMSRSSLYYLVGKEKAGRFGSGGIMSKIYQAGIIIIAGWAIYSIEKDKRMRKTSP